MFRLNRWFKGNIYPSVFVSILQMFRLNLEKNPTQTAIIEFQYFKCVGWIWGLIQAMHSGSVSILQMFRLNAYVFCYRSAIYFVSILQMFRLNSIMCRRTCNNLHVSILQMFRLNFKIIRSTFNKVVFQYFKCFGWIWSKNEIWR